MRSDPLAAFAYQGLECNFGWGPHEMTRRSTTNEECDPARGAAVALPVSSPPRLRSRPLTAELSENWVRFVKLCRCAPSQVPAGSLD